MAKQTEINTIITYNNVENPYISIKNFKEGKIQNSSEIFYSKDEIDENGLPINVDTLVENIKKVVEEKPSNVLLLLSCTQAFKSTYLLPNVNTRKADKLHLDSLKGDYKDLDNFNRITFNYKTSYGYIYYDYLVNSKMIEYFQKVCQIAGLNCVEYDLLHNYILKIVKTQIKNDIALFYKENDVVYLIVSIGNNLSSFSTFADDEKLYPLEFFKTIDKHFFELEKVQIVDYYCNYESNSLTQFDPTNFSLTYFNNIAGSKI